VKVSSTFPGALGPHQLPAAAGHHCHSFSAARWLPLCTVNVHSPIQVPVFNRTHTRSRPAQ